MLIQMNIYLKRPLISTEKELQSFGSFWQRLYLEKTDPYLGYSKQNCYSEVNKNLFFKYNSHIDCVAG